MDIYTLLKSKPHNFHYLDRYYKFILACQKYNIKHNLTKDTSYMENHHILPKGKSFFPEYKSFKQYPENLATLTARQHFIAHWMLWKAYGGKMTHAFVYLKNKCKNNNSYFKINSKIYDSIKKEISFTNRKYKHSKESKNKISESNRRRIISKETLYKKSSSMKKYYLNNKHPMLNKHHSDDTKKKLSNISLNRVIQNCRICNKSIKGNSNMIQHNRANH